MAREYFKDAPNVFVEDSIPINDGWTRDWGPSVRLRLAIMQLSGHTSAVLSLSWNDTVLAVDLVVHRLQTPLFAILALDRARSVLNVRSDEPDVLHAQCIAKTENGKRTVAGVCWDYDCYGASARSQVPTTCCA